MSEAKEEEFSPEVLLNPELLDEFINMFTGRMDARQKLIIILIQ